MRIFTLLKEICLKIRTKTEIDLLWTNASPTSNFAAQKIALDLAKYNGILVDVGNSTTAAGSKTITGCYCPMSKSSYVFTQIYTLRARQITADTTGVTFGAGIQANSSWVESTNNGVAVPIKIYGIKF